MSGLADRILTGDEDAVLTFYKTYSPRISTFLKNRLPRQEDAEELLNDIFLQAIDSLPRYQAKANLSTWLFAIAHHKVADFYRKQKIKSLLLSQAPFLEILAREIDDPEFIYQKDKMRDAIEAAFYAISEKYRDILRLHYEEEASVKELALHYDISVKAAESLLFRARKSFQKAYERG